MLKKHVFLFLSSLSVLVTKSQVNLVPNPSFEIGPDSTSVAWFGGIDSSCIITGTVLGPTSWSVINPSPDRLIEGDIPCNWDNDTAAFGKAYVVFGGQNESGQATLLSGVMKDSSYRLTCYVNLNTFRGIVTQPSKLCFKFTGSGDSIVTPFIASTDWKYFDTTFIATSNSSIIEIWGRSNAPSAINLDSLVLTKIQITAILPVNSPPNYSVYPIPARERIYFSGIHNINKIVLSDHFGKINSIYSEVSENYIDLPENLSGLYFIQIEADQKIINMRVLINNN